MEFAYISNLMGERKKSKILALLGYSLGIIIFQSFVIPKLDEWRSILLGAFLLIMMLFQSLVLLDLDFRLPISRRLYYILLTVLTIGILIMFLRFLW